MEQRIERARLARKLQEHLGNRYTVDYDSCESGLTRVYYRAKNGQMILTKECPNEDIHPKLNVNDFTLSKGQISDLLMAHNL